MGVSSSHSINDLKDNVLLCQLVGPTPVALEETYWEELLQFSLSIPDNSADARLLEEATYPLCKQLEDHTASSGNLGNLVKKFVERVRLLTDETKCENNLFTWHTHNCLFLLRSLLKYLIQSLPEDHVIQLLEASPHSLQATTQLPGQQDPKPPPVVAKETTPMRSLSSQDTPTSPSGGSHDTKSHPVTEELVSSLILILSEVPLIPFTYDIHMEATRTLLILLSGQMFAATPSTPSPFLQHVMATHMDRASLLIHTLLNHFMLRPLPPPENFRTHSKGFMSSLTSGLLSLILPIKSSGTDGGVSPLAEKALLLLLVLTNHCTHSSHAFNPYRKALFSFADERDNKVVLSGRAFGVSLEQLYHAVCQHLDNEETTLLLYLLLHGNPNMATFILSRSDIDLLVLPLLRNLYTCDSHNSHYIYMMLIILLILSQDDCFNKTIHEVMLSKVPWYNARTSISQISLGSLMVLIVINAMQINIAQMRDKYLHTNCLAALANMSSRFHSLHLQAAQKIISLFKVLAKKHRKISMKLKELPSAPAENQDCATDLLIVEEVLRMILEVVNCCLTHNLHNNPHLVYSLLYQRELFEPFRSHPSLVDILHNIDTVISFFAAKLEKEQHDHAISSANVLDLIVQASKTWPRDRLRQFPELKFKYVEEEHPEEFFIPYVWMLIHTQSGLYWPARNIRLRHSSSDSEPMTPATPTTPEGQQ